MRLVAALMAKNEADRYLPRVLERCLSFSDSVLVLDDRSTDATAKVAKDLGCKVRSRSILKGDAWGNESPARQELWDWGAEEAKDGWLLICDADMLLEGDPRELCYTWEYSGWAFVLWDCWDGEHQARVDGPWALGPHTPRPWLFNPSRALGGRKPEWSTRGLHVGHHPLNLSGSVGVAPPSEFYFKHLAYARKEDRVKKHAQYMGQAHQLTEFERMHAASIADA